MSATLSEPAGPGGVVMDDGGLGLGDPLPSGTTWTWTHEVGPQEEGTFTLVAGTGKFQGISGSSPLHARTAFGELAINLQSGAVYEASAGLMALPELKYTLP